MFDFTDRITQIIPCCQRIFEVGNDDGHDYKFPVVAFALVEDKRGEQKLIPLSIDDLGQIDTAEGCRISHE